MAAQTFAPQLSKLVGRKIRDRRNTLKLKQDALARKVGLSRTSITNIELGRQKLVLDQLYAIAEALSVEPRVLLPSQVELKQQTDITLESIKTRLNPDQYKWVEKIIDGKHRKGG